MPRRRPGERHLPLDPDRPAADADADADRGARTGRVQKSARPSYRPDVLAAVAIGGVLGTWARYALALAVPPRPGTFPSATFATNIAGSLFLGAVVVLITERWRPNRYLRPFLATGFTGAFTTWSTWAVDTDLLISGHRPLLATTYAAGSLALGLAAAYVGVGVGRLLAGAGDRS